jgi:phage terminase large subunit
VVIQANWRDNPRFPKVLNEERLFDLEHNPERYEHIWEGGYAAAFSGAYYAAALTKAKQEGRIGRVAADPLLPLRAYCDIGGAGAKADAFTIWIVQFVNREIRVLDYYESSGQTLDFHVNWMRKGGYSDAKVLLPHDGAQTDKRSGRAYAEHWRDAGFDVEVIPNQGAGAAMVRVENTRRLFPQIWFNEATTEAGRDALGFYHERRDEARGVGLGPEHDWSSHGADAFGMMCSHYQPPNSNSDLSELYSRNGRARSGGYLAA